ncbi:hypothetical protein [Gymnodinialimonas ceratoperidinii]|uniref:Uncharacterized protein n=1 Tax=Gymnodinialimonas ceratoperidinii TaxID=2856823 RepID=A0A8F6TVS2_9RHOB|nr:hypothetical protein [Gymnodinialimonas ceratoperidinii]QXT38819.1 hypothetical protein KYE46_12865 [Gymnodinialimonas ceratoperidinii]
MNPDMLPDDFGGVLSQGELTLVIIGAMLLRAVPLLVLASSLVKLKRFPALRALHFTLLASVLLIGVLALIEVALPALVPSANIWSSLWIFAVAWLCVTWTRSAIKTGLRPRVLDIATLAALAGTALALFLPLATST